NKNVNLLEPAPKPVLTGTKQDTRPIRELNLLLTIRPANMRNERLNRIRLGLRSHVAERLVMRSRTMSSPKNKRVRLRHTQREHQPANRVRLPDLTRNRQHHTANTARILTVSTQARRHSAQTNLPRV